MTLGSCNKKTLEEVKFGSIDMGEHIIEAHFLVELTWIGLSKLGLEDLASSSDDTLLNDDHEEGDKDKKLEFFLLSGRSNAVLYPYLDMIKGNFPIDDSQWLHILEIQSYDSYLSQCQGTLQGFRISAPMTLWYLGMLKDLYLGFRSIYESKRGLSGIGFGSSAM
ncbi:hypothetical protein HAX54_033785 [Datura stramonium]|uniref:Uncharacterized protein n=1 Tax=Datura stramonium TaxID=4076 RepID=A0ABS8VEI2_DATST|nr:hypothetical protein [Datura stramonium]